MKFSSNVSKAYSPRGKIAKKAGLKLYMRLQVRLRQVAVGWAREAYIFSRISLGIAAMWGRILLSLVVSLTKEQLLEFKGRVVGRLLTEFDFFAG